MIHFIAYHDLSAHQVHDIFKLRQDIFIVEQNCVFPDLDGLDFECIHGLYLVDDILVAYTRILPPSLKYKESSIGRIACHKNYRGQQYAQEIIISSINKTKELFPNIPIKIGAQAKLQTYYEKFGFKVCSDKYDEDGILHVDMLYS